jgi:drug/metabolite transporter (DMT)-like permease
MPRPDCASPRATDSTALLALVAGALAIAFAPILVRVSETGPVSTAFWRVTLSLPLLWAWLLAQGPAAAPRGQWTLLLLAGLFFAGDLGVWHASLALTSVANSTLLVNMAPVFVALGAWLLLRERLDRRFLLGMALALAGAVVLSRGNLRLSADTMLGDALALAAAASYAGYLLAVKRLRADCPTAVLMAWATTCTALALAPAMLASGERKVPETAAGWLTLAALALLPQVAGQGLITYALAHLPASFSSVALLLQPLAAAALAWLLLAEPVGALQAAGGAAVLAGILLARRGSV